MPDRISEIVRQVTDYGKILTSGYHRVILGRTIISPANHATPILQRGLFGETHSLNGKRPRARVLLYGSTENVC
jgi:hypothetical protein